MPRGVAWMVGVVCAAAVTLSAWSVSLSPRAWSRDASAAFSTAPDGGLAIRLPSWPSYVGYTWTTAPGPLVGTLVVSGRIDTVGTPIFRWDTEPWNTCTGSPAKLRPFVGQWPRKGRKHIAFADRWWAKDPYSVVLGPGAFSIAIPIDRVFWTGITPLPDTDPTVLDTIEEAIRPKDVGPTALEEPGMVRRMWNTLFS